MPRDKRNGEITYQNLWDTAKAILTGMFIIRINAYMKKHDKSQIKQAYLHLKELKRKEQMKRILYRRKK